MTKNIQRIFTSKLWLLEYVSITHCKISQLSIHIQLLLLRTVMKWTLL